MRYELLHCINHGEVVVEMISEDDVINRVHLSLVGRGLGDEGVHEQRW